MSVHRLLVSQHKPGLTERFNSRPKVTRGTIWETMSNIKLCGDIRQMTSGMRGICCPIWAKLYHLAPKSLEMQLSGTASDSHAESRGFLLLSVFFPSSLCHCLYRYHGLHIWIWFFILTFEEKAGGRFSKAPETFRARKAIAKSRTLRLKSCFIHIF